MTYFWGLVAIFVFSYICQQQLEYFSEELQMYTKMQICDFHMYKIYKLTVTCFLNLAAILVFYWHSRVSNQHMSYRAIFPLSTLHWHWFCSFPTSRCSLFTIISTNAIIVLATPLSRVNQFTLGVYYGALSRAKNIRTKYKNPDTCSSAVTKKILVAHLVTLPFLLKHPVLPSDGGCYPPPCRSENILE